MAGHNKWSTIKRHKKLTDDKKSKKFSIYSKEISNACIQYGVDPKVNFKLRNLINKAKLINMPNDKIEKAIAKKFGEEAITNPKSLWTDQKEKEYLSAKFQGNLYFQILILLS